MNGLPLASALAASQDRPVGLRERAISYALAIAAVLLGWGVHLALRAWVAQELVTFAMFYPAVIVGAFLGGRGPGLVAIASSMAVTLMPPLSLTVEASADVVRLVLFGAIGISVTALADVWRRSRRQAAAAQAAAVGEALACAEQARERSESSYRLLIDQAPDGIFVSDAFRRFLDVNEAGARMLGYMREEVLNRSIPDVILPEETSRLGPEIARLEDGTVVSSEWRFRRKDGSEFLGEVLGRQLPDGRLQAVVRDITERRRTEAAVRRERALLASITAATDAMLVFLDPQFNFVWVNEAYAAACRMRPEQMVGLNHFGLYPNPENEAIFRQVRDTGVPACFKDKPFEFPDQPERGVTWWDWTLNRVTDASGEVTGLVFSLRETTARVRAEQALMAAKAEAERANEAKSRFLAAASHDLRQPLSALSLYARLLRGKVGAADADLVANMEHCIGSLSGLLTDLLDLSKLQAGVIRPNPSDFAVDAWLEKLVSTFAPKAEAAGLEFRYRPSARIAHTDPVLLGRLLGNLLDNAIRYTPRGGVLVRCRNHQGKCWVGVWDTGIGIPAEQIGEIFEEFRQLDNAARSEQKGSGLGLAIVARMAELLGLEIRVQSRSGRGSLFAIELPLTHSAPTPPQDGFVVERTLRIGLVDDNAYLRQALARALESAGHEVVAAPSGKALLAFLGNDPPEVLISDYRLGDTETGIEVILLVRAAAQRPVPAVIITGDTEPALIGSMAARGITVLHKPLDLDALQTCLQALVSGRNAAAG